MKISEDIYYIGVNDHKIDLFESQYKVDNGMSYNSYLIIDDKITVLDTVDKDFKDQWLNNIKKIIQNKDVDYLVVHHMEPDHSSNILEFMKVYKNAIIVSSLRAFQMMKSFFNEEFINNRIIVNDNDELELGAHKLRFVSAPFVHWPEVIMSYESKEGVLFSSDAFGKFGALDIEDDWECEARRYYFGIIGKYGKQVQNVLSKIKTLNIKTICSLHGPILKDNIEYYLKLYDIWSSYKEEEEGVVIAFTSVYGNTKQAINILKEKLLEKGIRKVVINDLARCDLFEAIEDAFRYSKLVLATTTYNGDIFPIMKTYIDGLIERNYQNRTIAFIENGSWAINASRIMKSMLEECKNITFLESKVSILSSLKEDNYLELENLANELMK